MGLAKYEGEDGRRRLADALSEQRLVNGNLDLAGAMAALADTRTLAPGEVLIEQHAHDTTIYLILSGTLDVSANGRFIAKRWPGNSVGEMAAILPSQPRSATVTASEHSDVAVLADTDLATLSMRYPDIYRCLARELARRLLQRNALLAQPRQQVRVFIISSAEALEVSRAIQNAFSHDPFFVQPWNEGVFRVATYPIENLERELDQSDFAIAVCSPDDLTKSRGSERSSPRDNVIFELGFFMGRLGRQRTILFEPQGADVKLPSDLTGIQTIAYRYMPKPNLAAAIAPACNTLRDLIVDLGPHV